MRLNSCTTVKPSAPTWEGCLPLSEIDLVGSVRHIPTISFYPPPSQNWLTSNDTVSNLLKKSLSQALVHFYPLAGRLRWISGSSAAGGGRLELDCNSEGVEFIEAESESKLDDFGGVLTPVTKYRNLFPTIDYSLPIHDIPVTLVQLTRFSCGGISLGLAIAHAVVDGQSAFHFVSEWASLTRSEPVKTTPYLDRKVLGAGELASGPLHDDPTGYYLPELLRDHDRDRHREVKSDDSEQTGTVETIMLRLRKDDLEKLRNKAKDSGDNPPNRAYTRFEVVAAHVWRCACKARKLSAEQPTSLGVCVDTRNRVTPPLPKGYFGCGAFDLTVTGFAGELVSKPLGNVASKIREKVKQVTNDFVWSAVDYLKTQPDLTMFRSDSLEQCDSPTPNFYYENPNIGVVSWLTLPLYGHDFGWGKEIYMVPGEIEPESSFFIPDPSGDGSIIVALCLQTAHVDSFKKHFYNDVV
ncbi:Transferase [Trema orientale]|uniref:Transferase n=1 Tax=Trema orientale TaxID=63057 RepID=A0A2P5F474_TREOI|nr:Transferase [Trema orientale]